MPDWLQRFEIARFGRPLVLSLTLYGILGEPFSAVNRYPAKRGRALFGARFRRAFFDTYERSDSTDYFNVWTCRANEMRRATEAGR